ncbi:MAG: hypothetical protein AAF549_07215 [Pseudomonadota bacterium]
MKYTKEYLEMMEKKCPHLMDHLRYFEVLSEESDRGAILITASMLDETLKKLLLARFVEGESLNKLLNGFNAPIGTFSARIKAARAIGVISEEWQRELNILRNIRNEFAHSITTKLDDQPIVDRCNELQLCLPDKASDALTARQKYWMSASVILLESLDKLHKGEITRIEPLM